MKNYITTVILICFSILLQAQTSSGKHHIKYLEINTGNSDYSADFIDNDKVVFITSTSNKVSKNKKYQPHLDLFVGDMTEEGEILNKTRNKGIVTKNITKTGATFTKDGKTVYFSAKKYSKRKSRKPAKSILFKADIDPSGNWTNVQELAINKKNYTIENPSLNKDETRLYFSSDLPTTIGGKDLFVADVNEDGTLGAPKNLGDKVNTVKDEITPFIADNNFLYFSSNGREDSIGNFDIYTSEAFENTISEPLHLNAPINSINDDFAYIVNADKGYFSSNRLQGQDNDDIYSFYIEPDKPVECLQQIVGTVRDKDTEIVLPDAIITVLDDEGKEIHSLKTDERGNYRFTLGCASTYTIVAIKQEYSKEEHILNTANYISAPPLEVNQGLVKEPEVVTAVTEVVKEVVEEEAVEETPVKEVETPKEEVVVEENETEAPASPVYFGFDRSDITEAAATELDKLVTIMNSNTALKIKISSYTDSRGSGAYNLKLSNRRAQSTVDYLVAQGIDISRITAKGYGEVQMVNKCVNGVECSETAHSKNRRTEFNFVN